jgi:hypothetical protein
VNETNGTWGDAREVPGTASLNKGGIAFVYSVSCGSVGNCSAGGTYRDGSNHQQAFVVNESGGVWGGAEEVAGTAKLNIGGGADVYSVSCSSAGNCSAGGIYTDSSNHQQAFVVNETGRWGVAAEVPGVARLNSGFADVDAVSCGSAGNCSAGGIYTDVSGRQAFVVNESKGKWGVAEEVPGTSTLNAGANAQVESVSCASARSCSAGGYYAASSTRQQAFIVDEKDGTWGIAKEVPGTPTMNAGGSATINSVSCASAGNCSAGGYFTDRFGASQALVVDERAGEWHIAEELPGSGALNVGGGAAVYAVSCSAVGECSAGGYYTDSFLDTQAFVGDEAGGRWVNSEEVPGSGALNASGAAATASLACAATTCSAGGNYESGFIQQQAFVVDRQPPHPPSTGYRLVGRDGGVFSFAAPFFGSLPAEGIHASDIVGIADADAGGYWLAASDGTVYAFGDAKKLGSLADRGLHVSDVVGMSSPDAGGYWLVGRDGAVYAFGDARLRGSLAGRGSGVADIVGMAGNAPSGYRLIGGDGGVFAFGLPFLGSLPAEGIAVSDIVGIAPAGSGGYRIAARGGAVYSFGGPSARSSIPAEGIHVSDIVGVASGGPSGYRLVGDDGGVFCFGAPFLGSLPAQGIRVSDIVAIAPAA